MGNFEPIGVSTKYSCCKYSKCNDPFYRGRGFCCELHKDLYIEELEAEIKKLKNDSVCKS